MGRVLFPIYAAVIAVLYVSVMNYNVPYDTQCLTVKEASERLMARGIFHKSQNAPPGKVCPKIILRDASEVTTCQEEDNIKAGLFIGNYTTDDPSKQAKITGFRFRAIQPVANTDFHHFGSNFSHCDSFSNPEVLHLGNYSLGSGQFSSELSTTTDHPSYEFYAQFPQVPNTCSPYNDSKTLFPSYMSYKNIRNLTVHFTSWLNFDQRGLFGGIGTDTTINLEKSTGRAMLDIYFSNSTNPEWVHFLSCRLNKTNDMQKCFFTIPDLYKPEGCYTSQLHLVLNPDADDIDASAEVYFDSFGLAARGSQPYPTIVLQSSKTQVVTTEYQDFWFRYPELLNVTAGGKTNLNSSFVTYSQSRHDYYIDQLVQTFVLYEDGNIRLTPYPKQGWLQIPFGASFIFGRTANYSDHRPIEPVKAVYVHENTAGRFKADVTYQANTLEKPWLPKDDYTVKFDLQSDESSTTLTVTGIEDYALPGTRLGIFRSMATTKAPCYPGMNDADTAIVYDRETQSIGENYLSFPSNDTIVGDILSFVRLCPSYHNSDAPEFTAEVLCEVE